MGVGGVPVVRPTLSLLRTLQGRIQVRLRGGGEFQLVELMYILGENKIWIWWDLFTATYQGKVAFNLNPEVDVGGGGGSATHTK